MKPPPHPGKLLRELVLPQMGVAEFAAHIGMTKGPLYRLLNKQAALSTELAIRLEAALGVTAETWLRMQIAYDLWHAQRKRRPKIRPVDEPIVEAVERTAPAPELAVLLSADELRALWQALAYLAQDFGDDCPHDAVAKATALYKRLAVAAARPQGHA